MLPWLYLMSNLSFLIKRNKLLTNSFMQLKSLLNHFGILRIDQENSETLFPLYYNLNYSISALTIDQWPMCLFLPLWHFWCSVYVMTFFWWQKAIPFQRAGHFEGTRAVFMLLYLGIFSFCHWDLEHSYYFSIFNLKWLPKTTLLAPLFPEEESKWLLLVLPSSGPSRWCKSELRSWSIGSSGPAHLVCSHAHIQITDLTVAWCCTFYMLTKILPPSKLLTHQIASLLPWLGRRHDLPCYSNLPAQGDLLLRGIKCSWSWPIQGPLGL